MTYCRYIVKYKNVYLYLFPFFVQGLINKYVENKTHRCQLNYEVYELDSAKKF